MTKDRSVVGAQLLGWLLVVILTDLNVVMTTPHLIAIVFGGASLWAASAMQLGQSYSSSTRPQTSNVFVCSGVYRYVRHPIYTGLLTVAFAFVLSGPTIPVVTAFLFAGIVTNVRAGLEEDLLEERYPEYSEYRARTRDTSRSWSRVTVI